MTATVSADVRVRTARPGERWHPWNFGLLQNGAVVTARSYETSADAVVLTAYSDTTLVGCAAYTVVGREDLERSEEYSGGESDNGPFFHRPSGLLDARSVLLHSLWVSPAHREQRVASRVCAELAALGLPAYVEFAEPWIGGWFHRRYRPDRVETSA